MSYIIKHCASDNPFTIGYIEKLLSLKGFTKILLIIFCEFFSILDGKVTILDSPYEVISGSRDFLKEEFI